MRLAAALTACVLIAGCGGDDDSAREDAARTYCENLQKAGALLEPMSQCLKEYEEATREPD